MNKFLQYCNFKTWLGLNKNQPNQTIADRNNLRRNAQVSQLNISSHNNDCNYNINVDYYDILNLPFEASPVLVKMAYYELAQKYHPEINQNRSDHE